MEELLGGSYYALMERPNQQLLYEIEYATAVLNFLVGAFWGIKNVVV